jgi:hypothetical protein
MKRSTASWTTAIAASALLAMPVGSWAQQTSPASSQTTSKPAGAQSSANEDLRKAEAALNDIPAASLTGQAKSRVAELKRHITALQRTSSAGKSASASAGKTSASTELAAADRILTELLGGEGTTGAAAPSPAGTTGKPASKAAPGVDEAAKAKLQEVRTHLTAFAASMGGAPSSSPTPSADDPAAGASAAAAAAAATPSSPAPSATPSTPSSTASASPAAPSASSQSSTPSSPATTPTPSEPAAQAQAGQQPAAAAQAVDTDAVKKHLTAARDSLSQMTQLPAAAQLTGDARTQVSQLISNFNELITTNSEWRASYAKVQANLNALVGEQRADESPAPAPGAAGAVGTSGTATVDPAIKAKLVEFRTHLMDFEKAAGGGATAAASPTPSPASPAEPAAAAAQPSTPATTPSTPAAPPTEPTPSPTPTEPTPSPTPTTPAEPSPTGTSGRTSAPAPTGTTGTTPSTAPATATPTAERGEMQSEAMTHIEAIEAILNGARTAGTSGSTASKPSSGASSLDREQIEQIRTHLAALRKALNKSDK